MMHIISSYILAFILVIQGFTFIYDKVDERAEMRCKRAGWEFVDRHFKDSPKRVRLRRQVEVSSLCIRYK